MCWGPMNPNSQSEGYCSVPIRQIAAASTKPAREQNRAPENCFRLGFEPLPSNPSPGPLRLVKAPAAGHPLPKGEGCAGNTSDSCPLLWGEGGDPAVAGEPGEGSFPFSEGRTPTQHVNSDSRHNSAEVHRSRCHMYVHADILCPMREGAEHAEQGQLARAGKSCFES